MFNYTNILHKIKISYFLNLNYNPINHKDSYTYLVKYNDAIHLLKEIQPYLVIESKRSRAKLITEGYKKLTPRNGKYSAEMLIEKEIFL